MVLASTPSSFKGGMYQSRHPAVQELLTAQPWLRQRLGALTALSTRLAARWEGAMGATQVARDAKLDASAALTAARNQKFERGGADPKAIAAAEAELASAIALLEDSSEAASVANEASAVTRDVMNVATAVMNTIASRKSNIIRIAPNLPVNTVPLWPQVVATQREAITALLATRAETENAPPPRDEAEAQLVLQATAMAKGPAIALGPKGAQMYEHLVADAGSKPDAGPIAEPDLDALTPVQINAHIEHLRAELLELGRLERKRQLVRVDEVMVINDETLTTAKSRLLAIPGRLDARISDSDVEEATQLLAAEIEGFISAGHVDLSSLTKEH